MRSVQRFILLLVVLGICVLATKIVSAKAVGIWLFDEGKGDTIKEAQGYKHDGEFVGGVKWEKAGEFGSAVRFDGKTGHIEIPDPDHILAPKHLTLMAWVKVDNVSGTKSIMEQYDWLPDLGIHAFRINGTTIAPLSGTPSGGSVSRVEKPRAVRSKKSNGRTWSEHTTERLHACIRMGNSS